MPFASLANLWVGVRPDGGSASCRRVRDEFGVGAAVHPAGIATEGLHLKRSSASWREPNKEIPVKGSASEPAGSIARLKLRSVR